MSNIPVAQSLLECNTVEDAMVVTLANPSIEIGCDLTIDFQKEFPRPIITFTGTAAIDEAAITITGTKFVITNSKTKEVHTILTAASTYARIEWRAPVNDAPASYDVYFHVSYTESEEAKEAKSITENFVVMQ